MCFFNKRTWRNLNEHWILAAIWHLLAFSFLFFNGNNTVFVQFRQSTFCRPTISHAMLSVLFAVTPICCTRSLNHQRDVCDVSLHFVSQVAFNKLNMLLIFFAMFERTFSSMPCTFYLQWIDLQWENGQYLDGDQRWGSMTAADQRHVHSQFYYFFFDIRSRINEIK